MFKDTVWEGPAGRTVDDVVAGLTGPSACAVSNIWRSAWRTQPSTTRQWQRQSAADPGQSLVQQKATSSARPDTRGLGAVSDIRLRRVRVFDKSVPLAASCPLPPGCVAAGIARCVSGLQALELRLPRGCGSQNLLCANATLLSSPLPGLGIPSDAWTE